VQTCALPISEVSDTDAPSGPAGTEAGEGSVDEGQEGDEGQDAPADGEEGQDAPADGEKGQGSSAADGSAEERLDQALTDMDAAVADAAKAMEGGDWAAYGDAQERTSDALNRAIEASEELGGNGVPVPHSHGGRGGPAGDHRPEAARPAPAPRRNRPGLPAF